MSFWRKEVIQAALDNETAHHIKEQRAWIEREPANPHPYLNLAQLYRMESRGEEALALMLHAVKLDPDFADAHVALAESYVTLGDYPAAWRHAHRAQEAGDSRAVEFLSRHSVPE